MRSGAVNSGSEGKAGAGAPVTGGKLEPVTAAIVLIGCSSLQWRSCLAINSGRQREWHPLWVTHNSPAAAPRLPTPLSRLRGLPVHGNRSGYQVSRGLGMPIGVRRLGIPPCSGGRLLGRFAYGNPAPRVPRARGEACGFRRGVPCPARYGLLAKVLGCMGRSELTVGYTTSHARTTWVRIIPSKEHRSRAPCARRTRYDRSIVHRLPALGPDGPTSRRVPCPTRTSNGVLFRCSVHVPRWVAPGPTHARRSATADLGRGS